MALSYNFIDYLKTIEAETTTFLKSGIRLNGVITAFDGESMYLTRGGNTQLIFADSVATVMPDEPISKVIMDRLKQS